MKKIAIQGFPGSFHEIAAKEYFAGEQVSPVCCATFEEVFENVRKDMTVIGLVAIENTIAGSLLHNYELLRDSGLVVAGEHKLHISHCICCLPDEDVSDIVEVHSHPVALQQCRGFLGRHPKFKIVEDEDTAGAAKYMMEHPGECRGRAAICSSDAARMYGARILEDHIEDNKHNFTRFLVICDHRLADSLRSPESVNKAGLVFALPHEEGSLSCVLSILSFYKINLTKIQSLPIIGHEWEYLFYVDVTFDKISRYRQSLMAIAPLTKELHVLGEYVEY